MIGVSRPSIYAYIKSGDINAQQIEGGTYVFLRADIDDFIANRLHRKTRRQKQKEYDTIQNVIKYFEEPNTRQGNPLSARQAKIWLNKFADERKVQIVNTTPNPTNKQV